MPIPWRKEVRYVMRKIVLATIMAFAFTFALGLTPAWAKTCPKLIKQANDAMAKGGMEKAKMDDAKKLVTEAQSLHDKGQHAQSEEKAKAALKLLGVKMEAEKKTEKK